MASKSSQASDTKAKMIEVNIIKIIESTMEEKVKVDLESESLSFMERDIQVFHVFIYDSLIMQYGLKTIANKNIVQMYNGL